MNIFILVTIFVSCALGSQSNNIISRYQVMYGVETWYEGIITMFLIGTLLLVSIVLWCKSEGYMSVMFTRLEVLTLTSLISKCMI